MPGLVRRPAPWIPVRACEPLYHPVVLRRYGSILLQWQRRQLSPTVRQQVRPTGFNLYQGFSRFLRRWTLVICRGSPVLEISYNYSIQITTPR